MERRTLLTGVGAGTMMIAAPRAPFAEATKPLDVDRMGPAAMTAATRGAVVRGTSSIFLTSRLLTAEKRLRVGQYSLADGSAISLHDLDIPTVGGSRIADDGTHVYIGPAVTTHVWRYTPETGEVEAWAPLGPNMTVQAMAVHSGQLYTATYPDCTIRQIDLATGSVGIVGRVSETSNYAMAVAVSEDWVFGGASVPPTLVAWPRGGGEPHDLTESLGENPGGVIDLLFANGRLHIASGRRVISVRPDGSDRFEHGVVSPDRYVDNLAADPNGVVYAIARSTSNIYRVDPDGLHLVGRPVGEAETQCLAASESDIFGVTGLGYLWRQPLDGPAETWDAGTAGFDYPEMVQSMHHNTQSTRVWVGGHYRLTRHNVVDGTMKRIDVAGEVKAMTSGTDGELFVALYPSTVLARVDPDSMELAPCGSIGNGQLRIKRIAPDLVRSQLVIPSSPVSGQHQGALTFYDIPSGSLTTRTDYLPDQSVMDVSIEQSTAYIVGDTYGESTPGPIRPVAEVAAVDLASRELLWRREIGAGWESYENVLVKDGILYCLARRPRGAWVAYDLTAQKIINSGTIGGYGTLDGSCGRIFAWVHFSNEIVELPTGAEGSAKTLHTVPRGWFNNPMFNFTQQPGSAARCRRPRGGRSAGAGAQVSTWGMWGTDLALFEL